jgi:hypothetical protein
MIWVSSIRIVADGVLSVGAVVVIDADGLLGAAEGVEQAEMPRQRIARVAWVSFVNIVCIAIPS